MPIGCQDLGCDLEDVFVPMGDNLFTSPTLARYDDSFPAFTFYLMCSFSTSIENLLQSLPQQNAETAHYESALGTALVAALGALVSGLLLYHGLR